LDEDTIVGVLNIPPEYTSCSSQDAYSELENEYLFLFFRNHKYITLIGYFNGRTAQDTDYITIDNNKNGNEAEEFIQSNIHTLDLLDIPRNSYNSDKMKNGFGKKIRFLY
jgi:hypothetical protein